jgi:hypothetical protein
MLSDTFLNCSAECHYLECFYADCRGVSLQAVEYFMHLCDKLACLTSTTPYSQTLDNLETGYLWTNTLAYFYVSSVTNKKFIVLAAGAYIICIIKLFSSSLTVKKIRKSVITLK